MRGGYIDGRKDPPEYLRTIHPRYRKADRQQRWLILDEFCSDGGYNRKYAMRLLNKPLPSKRPGKSRNRVRPVASVEGAGGPRSVWEAGGYPWSLRLKALLPTGCPGRAGALG